MNLVPGENTSTIARVLEEPKEARAGNKRFKLVKISDGETIINLVAWEGEIRKLGYQKGDLLEIYDAFYPENKKPPMLEIVKKTRIKKTDLPFPETEECMRKRFMQEAREGEYIVCEGLVTQVYSTESIYCMGCGEYTEGACGCDSEKKKVLRVQGAFSDGTDTLQFTTDSERIAKKMGENPMEKTHTLLGYIHEGRLYIEEVFS